VDYELEYGSDRLEIQRHAFVTITPSASILDEGQVLTTTVSTTAIAPGTTFYYKLSGKGIDASGTLTGQETVGSDGSLLLSHAIANDERTEGPEVLEIRIFADSDHRLQLGDTARVTINDTSATQSCAGKRVLVVDDLLATGGTAAAAGELVTLAGGNLCGFGFVIELAELGGRGKLPAGVPVESLIVYS
jgi:pyrimidine operon attenuation protein/uracil phosphoribosyltransferase